MLKFYICNTCGNFMVKIDDSGVIPTCCGKPMRELVPDSTDGDEEKHVPVIQVRPITSNVVEVEVKVGSTPHPTETHHFIKSISLETEHTIQVIKLKPGDAPSASFYVAASDPILEAYAYCNLHGLWKMG